MDVVMSAGGIAGTAGGTLRPPHAASNSPKSATTPRRVGNGSAFDRLILQQVCPGFRPANHRRIVITWVHSGSTPNQGIRGSPRVARPVGVVILAVRPGCLHEKSRF